MLMEAPGQFCMKPCPLAPSLAHQVRVAEVDLIGCHCAAGRTQSAERKKTTRSRCRGNDTAAVKIWSWHLLSATVDLFVLAHSPHAASSATLGVNAFTVASRRLGLLIFLSYLALIAAVEGTHHIAGGARCDADALYNTTQEWQHDLDATTATADSNWRSSQLLSMRLSPW